MQCPVCHNEVGPQSTFCNHCGASLAAAVPPVAASQAPYTSTPGYSEVPPAYTAPPAAEYAPPPGYAVPPTYPPPQTQPGAGGLSSTAAAAIAYITFIPAIIFLVVEPYNRTPLVRFHSIQSIALNIVAFVIQMAVTVIAICIAFIPVFGLLSLLFTFVHLALFVIFFIVWIMAIMKASKGEFYKIPLIGDYCMKQAQGGS